MANRFRTSFTHKAGQDPVKIVQGKVMNMNLVNWTVDVFSQFDRHRYFDIQVSSPYVHYNNGEGISITPEVGAVCYVCIPGDSSPPFVLCFIMPHEVVDSATDDAPLGTRSHGAAPVNASDASFAGGRPKAKPGDFSFKGRDGNWITLHRGGVLSIGATETAQRIYIPLNNTVMDFSENYAHHNVGGSVLWGLQEGPALAKYPTQHLETFRVFADDKYADIRISKGRVYSAVPEPDGNAERGKAGIVDTDDNPIIYEVSVSPKGFFADSGDIAGASTVKESVYKFTFDRQGNTYLRCEGNVVAVAKKKLSLHITSELDVTCEAGSIKAKNGFTVDGGTDLTLKGTVVRIGQGQSPVARQGDPVTIGVVNVPVVITFASMPTAGAPTPGVMTVGPTPATPQALVGAISGGAPDVLG